MLHNPQCRRAKWIKAELRDEKAREREKRERGKEKCRAPGMLGEWEQDWELEWFQWGQMTSLCVFISVTIPFLRDYCTEIVNLPFLRYFSACNRMHSG